jgi:uracil-DNA glycosylase
MISKVIPRLRAFEAWRSEARALLAAGVPPEQVRWDDHALQKPLFDDVLPTSRKIIAQFKVPTEFLHVARKVIAHRSEERFSRAYQVLWRLQKEPHLLSNPADADVHHLQSMAKSVSRDCHKMKAFVRFRELQSQGERRTFGAWFEPDHHIVELTGPFFARRFADMDWVISTPEATALFVDGHLSYAPPDGVRHAVSDTTEDLWRTYYSNIFNPARLKIKAMESEMPRKYWKNLPEAALIPDLIAGAAQRAQKMRDQMPSVPPSHLHKFKAPTVDRASVAAHAFASIDEARAAASQCTRCPLHCHATQTVFGEGPASASILFVGEQPGDQEDIAGKAFVGPAGQIFDAALIAAGINRSEVYVTNAVKHFKFSPRGKRRIHERPNRYEIQHCKWWLDKELNLIKPRLVVAMGATAWFALTGRNDGLKNMRGTLQHRELGPMILPTYHPSAILRNQAESDAIRRDFFADIASISRFAGCQPKFAPIMPEDEALL